MFSFYMLMAKIGILILLYLFLFLLIVILYFDLRRGTKSANIDERPCAINLKIIKGPSSILGKTYSFQDQVEIGRSKKSNLLIDDPTISKHHALLTQKDSVLYLEDLNSTNGTFLGGKKITKPTIVERGSNLQVGGVTIVYLG